MADKIKESDIVEGNIWESTTNNTKALIKLVTELENQLKGFAEVSKKALGGASKASSFEDLKKANAEIDKLNKAFEDRLKLDKERATLIKTLANAEAQAAKQRQSQIAKNKKAEQDAQNTRVKNAAKLIADKKKEAKAQEAANKRKIASDKREAAEKLKADQKKRKSTVDNANAYKRLSKQVNFAQARFKRLAAQYGENDKRTRKALKTFNRLDARLRSINQTARDGRRDVGRYGLAFGKFGTSLRNIARGLIIVQGLRAIGNAIRDAARRVVEFDKELQNIAGITGTTRDSLKDLEKAIIDVSSSSIRTSNEVAKLATTLFTLGKTKEEVKLLLKPINDLSIAFGVSSDSAADFLGQTLSAFGKGAESGQEFADIIANVRTSTALDFERIKDGLGFIAPTANALNLTLGETSALLGVLQNNGVRAARAGRLLNSSFARIIDRGLTLDEALEQINESQNKIATSSELFGKEALALGLILADNTEKTAELANEFDNLSDGSLKKLTDQQLKSLDAQFKILDSTWEKFILNIENGSGVFSKFTESALDNTIKLINGYRRLNQTTQENIEEDISIRLRGLEQQVTRTRRVIIDNAKKQRDEEIASFKEKLDAQKVLKKDFDQAVERSNKKLADAERNARNDAILSQIQVEKNVRERLLLNNEFTDITVFNANMVIEKNKEQFFELTKSIREEKKRKREEAAAVQVQTARIEKLKTMLTVVKEETASVIENTSALGGNGDAIKKVIGLINNQAKAVADLNDEIQSSLREGGDAKAIEELGFEYAKAVKELERLRRIAFSTREEFEKKEIDLIEDRIDREIEAEMFKSEEIRKAILDNTKATEEERQILFAKEVERVDRFINEKEIERGRIAIKRASDLAKAEFEQRRSGFKKEEEFEKEKAEQFKAIQLKALEDELALLERYATEANKVKREQLKAEIESYYEFAKERVKIEIDVIELLEALNEKYFSEQLDRVDRQISDLEKRERNLQDLANRGQQEASDSLAENQKNQAEAAKKREDLLQKEKQFELALAIIASYRAELKREPTPTTGEALANTIASTSVLTSIVQAIPLFDGTEDTGNGGNVDSRGGFHAILHPNERVISKKENMKMGGVSNEDAATIVHDFNNDLLSYNTPQLNIQESRFDSSEQLLKKFDSLEKNLVSAINNKETYLGSDIDTMKKIILQSYQKGSTRTTVKSKYPTRR